MNQTDIIMENDYHNPYDHRMAMKPNSSESDHQSNHYEAPSCLVRNPSGSLFIPSSDPLGQTTIDSRLRFDTYSPHHGTHHLREKQNGSPSGRSPNGDSFKHIERGTLPSYSSQLAGMSSRIGSGTTSRGDGGPGGGGGPAGLNNVVPNLQSMRRSSPNSSSQYSQWRIQKDLGGRCSWKFVAIFFVLLSVILVSALIYTTASNFLKMSYDNAKACAVVETTDVGSNLIESTPHRIQPEVILPNQPSEEKSHFGGNRHRASLPPDGTTFSHLALGELQKKIIPSYSYWNFQFHQKESSYVELDMILPRGSSLGLYARKNAIPTLTLNDIHDVLSGFRNDNRISRSIPTVTRSVSYFLEQGHWFLSLYNDDMDAQEVSFVVRVSQELTQNCPQGCNGRGQCVLGRCQCEAGYDGPDCGQSMCPVLCSGHGDYEDGQCRCFPGWKGLECQLRHDQCEVADCSGHGQCVNGKCVCARGYTGNACQQTDCPDPNCSDHGFCVEGSCVCRQGWRGPTCATVDHEARQCLPDCSGHGDFDLETQKCICRGQWTGNDCSKERCNLDCGPHGSCESGRCVCDPGWQGDVCTVKTCDPRCSAHGMCSNGTCLCTNGWNGKHCTLEGCPKACNGHGQCKTNHNLEWECWCESGWFGTGCDMPLEQDCSDRRDNDQDGLIDCEDPECCENPVCRKSQLCHTVPFPIDILLRKQPPSSTASFFERMKFIIEDKGLQSYVEKAGFNESLFWSQFSDRRAAVVRGQVVTESGMGLIGVRVSTTLPNEGFTMTRDNGWFDLMVNGGGPVMLQFGRNPYPPLRLNIYVPWNEVIVLDPVKLSLTSDTGVLVPDILAPRIPCKDHDFKTMKPLVLATWKHGSQGQMPGKSSILVESQSVLESIDLAESGIKLVYHSARAKDYLSTIQLQLTPDQVPTSLLKVHIRITIEGVVHEKVFEADPNIRYTYAWDGLNEYRQRVYGVTTATVRVGYEYRDCGNSLDGLVWHIETTRMSGHDLASTDIGGWNLHVQHKYNFHSGILQKGDGNTIYLKYKPQVVTTLMGTGDSRDLSCTSISCSNGQAVKQKLLAPKALASSPDGAIYVADYNLIRKITPDGLVSSLLKLNSSRVSYRYHLAHCTYMSPDLEQLQTLYISQPEQHQIIRINKVSNVENGELESNFERFIGNGDRCLPGDSDGCGDGGKAINARLAYPKGIAMGVDGKIFIADGTNIRQVDENGYISTLVGHQHHRSIWRPMPCEGSSPSASEVQLNWPSELAISPLDGTLHFIDDNVVLKLTSDKRLTIVAGRPLHCRPSIPKRPSDLAIDATLIEPQSLAFAPNGDLYIAESDSQKINRVRKVTTDGRITLVAGREAECNCLDASCLCYDPDKFLASDVHFSAISALSVTPDSVVVIADQGNYRLRSVTSGLPPDKADGVFEVPDAESQESYIFNKFGQHEITKDLMTGMTKYKMTYTQTTSTGKLASVTNAYGAKLTVLRDYKGRVNALQTASGLKFDLQMSRVGDLETLASDQLPIKTSFRYYGSSGLLKSKLDSHYSYHYEYDVYGRLVQSILPTGEAIGLHFNLTSQGASIEVTSNGILKEVALVQDQLVSTRPVGSDLNRRVVSVTSDKALVQRDPHGYGLTIGTIPHPVIQVTSDPVMADSFPMPGEQRTFLGTNLINTLTWKYSLASGAGSYMGISKTLKVNNEDLLTIHYDKLQRRQLLFSLNSNGKDQLLEIRYDSLSRPLVAEPAKGSGFATVTQSYDVFGNLDSWSWGDLAEKLDFDQTGRLKSRSRSNETLISYEYQEDFDVLPKSVIIDNKKSKYEIVYDDVNGGLKRVKTPMGHFYDFNLKSSVGLMRFQIRFPWITETDLAFELMYNGLGQIMRKRMPSKDHQHVTYAYGSNNNMLRKIMAGETESEFGYNLDTGLMESVVTRCGHHFDMRTRMKYHGGLMKEMKIRFSGSSSPDFDNAVFRYQYDGNGRLAVLLSSIGAGNDHQHTDTFTYNAHTGKLEAVSGLRLTNLAINKTILTDSEDNFYKTIEYDGLGRIAGVTIGLQRQEMLSYTLQYDPQGRLRSRSIKNHEGRPSEETFSYRTSGELIKVWGPDNFEYDYDLNGNLIRTFGSQGEVVYTNKGDRVQRVASKVSDFKVTYDPVSGCVASIISKDSKTGRKFWHDARGKLVQMAVSGKNSDAGSRTSYQYDHLQRLVASIEVANGGRGGQKIVTQYFYSDIRFPNRVTHVQSPRSGLTQRLLYDEQGHLVALETKDQKLYVAADHVGSPLLIFRPDGTVDKAVKYSAYGLVLSDSSPIMSLPVGYRGGLNIGSGLVMIDQRVYDVLTHQWLNPDWERLQNELNHPNDLYVYRFLRNDPMNDYSKAISYEKASSLNNWAKLYGYDMDVMIEAPKQPHVASKVANEDLLAPDLRLASGLDTAIHKAKHSLQELSFIPIPPFKDRIVLNPSLASSGSGFGPGFLLTSMASNGLTYANVVEGAPGVTQTIFLSVLNGTKLLDDVSYYDNAKKSVFYFAKKTGTASDIAEALMSSDMDSVNRLAGQFKVKVNAMQRGKDLMISNDNLELHVFYSDNPSIQLSSDLVLQEAALAASNSAWFREKSLVTSGFTGYGDWTNGQQKELLALRPGQKPVGIRGYDAVEIQKSKIFPHLIRDESNYGFVSESLQNRRRKNRHGKTRKYA